MLALGMLFNRRWQVALRARRDGRRAEKQLQSWLTSVPQADHLNQELTEALTTFLASYGKSPSTACRISVTSDFYQSQNNRSADDHVLTNLLIAVASRLSPEERLGLRAALWRESSHILRFSAELHATARAYHADAVETPRMWRYYNVLEERGHNSHQKHE